MEYPDRKNHQDGVDRVEKENRYRMLAGLGNYFGLILGVICILVCIALLISLLNWLRTDISSVFSVVLSNFR